MFPAAIFARIGNRSVSICPAGRATLLLSLASLLGACASVPTLPQSLSAWPDRMHQLQATQSWDLEGRAAAAVGTQGWQAHLTWQQQPDDAQVQLAGPLGVGAIALTLGPAGVKIRDPVPAAAAAAASAAAASAHPDAVPFLEQRLGFSPPFTQLRFWLLGVPSPDRPFQWESNAMDRAQSIEQDGWRVEYADYMRVGQDVLPRRMTLTHESVRVRVAVDRWTLGP